MPHDRTILAVDDDNDINQIVAQVLEDEGYHVVQASGGREALRLLTEGGIRPDMILLDLMMPEMDGRAFRAAQQSVPALAAIPVLLFTAYAVSSEDVVNLGVAGILRKPVGLADLLGEIERIERSSPSLPLDTAT